MAVPMRSADFAKLVAAGVHPDFLRYTDPREIYGMPFNNLSGLANAGNDCATGAYQQALQSQLMAAYGPAYNPPPTKKDLEMVKLKVEQERLAKIQQHDKNMLEQYKSGAMLPSAKQPEEKTMAVDTNSELLPDISLARVFKWAIVLIVAMGLGRRVWDLFGAKITDNLHKALDITTGKA